MNKQLSYSDALTIAFPIFQFSQERGERRRDYGKDPLDSFWRFSFQNKIYRGLVSISYAENSKILFNTEDFGEYERDLKKPVMERGFLPTIMKRKFWLACLNRLIEENGGLGWMISESIIPTEVTISEVELFSWNKSFLSTKLNSHDYKKRQSIAKSFYQIGDLSITLQAIEEKMREGQEEAQAEDTLPIDLNLRFRLIESVEFISKTNSDGKVERFYKITFPPIIIKELMNLPIPLDGIFFDETNQGSEHGFFLKLHEVANFLRSQNKLEVTEDGVYKLNFGEIRQYVGYFENNSNKIVNYSQIIRRIAKKLNTEGQFIIGSHRYFQTEEDKESSYWVNDIKLTNNILSFEIITKQD